MSNKDKIHATLAVAKGAICDDCLSERADVAPRQTVFQICLSLSKTGRIHRAQAACSYCGKLKRVNQTVANGARTRSIEANTLAVELPAPAEPAKSSHPWY
jgi:hypothetical protein